MNYSFKPTALRDLKKLPRDVQGRIIKKLDFYSRTRNPIRFAEPIKDRDFGEYRFRAGDYRIIFDIVDQEIVILVVGHRKDIYR